MTNKTSHKTMRLLASTGILGLALAMAPVGLDLSLDAVKIGPIQALAESGSGSDGDGGSDNSGSGSDSDNSGPGGGGDDHDNSGPGGGGDDHDNSGPGSANSGGDHDNSGPGSANSGRRHGDRANNGGGDDGQRPVRPEITLDLPADDLNDVMAGRKHLVDDLGRVLEVEIELEHGFRTVIAKPHGGDSRRNPGPITSFTLVDAGGATNTPGDDDGTPDQGPGDN